MSKVATLPRWQLPKGSFRVWNSIMARRQARLATTVLVALAACPCHAQALGAFAPCAEGQQYQCVVDGRTFWLENELVQLQGIVRVPSAAQSECELEAHLAEASIKLLTRALNTVGSRPSDAALERVGMSPDGLPLVRITGRSGDISRIMSGPCGPTGSRTFGLVPQELRRTGRRFCPSLCRFVSWHNAGHSEPRTKRLTISEWTGAPFDATGSGCAH